MKRSVYRAFGYVFIINDLDVGDVMDVVVNNSTRAITYCVSGDFEVYDAETNERYPENYSKGDFYRTAEEPVRNYKYVCIEKSRGFCYTPGMNNNVIPQIEKVFIPASSTKTFPKGKKFLLMEGCMTVQKVEYIGPTRIQFSTADQTVKAVTDCYGVIIE